MADKNTIDLIQGPVQLATQMILAQQERVGDQLQPNRKPERQEMIGDIPLEAIMPTIQTKMEIR